jgi:hypothetical protein
MEVNKQNTGNKGKHFLFLLKRKTLPGKNGLNLSG